MGAVAKAERDAIRSAAFREAAAEFRVHGARAWGHDAAWLTTGTQVAELVAEWLEEMAHG